MPSTVKNSDIHAYDVAVLQVISDSGNTYNVSYTVQWLSGGLL